MAEGKIYFFCPDESTPFGGTKLLYRQVEILRAAGIPAYALHRRPGFRYEWFYSTAEVDTAAHIVWQPEDFLVAPEIYGSSLYQQLPIPRKVIFNQNCYYTFRSNFGLNTKPEEIPYYDPRVAATFVVSQDSWNYLRYAFPSQRLFHLIPGVDDRIFHPGENKLPQIAFMPRKNIDDIIQVLNCLKYRGSLKDYVLKPIDGKNERQVAEILRQSSLFLSFGFPEGFGLPALEAMFSGTYVVGYHGRGGREFMRPEFCDPIEVGDIVGYCQAVEKFMATPREIIDQKTQQALSFARERYSLERERLSILAAWKEIRV